MLGYIVPEKPELKIREYEIYSGYYCGICKSIGKRHGQIPRMSLSYDSVFLALVSAGLDESKEQMSIERCIVHPRKKRPIILNSFAVDYAADMHLLMVYHKLRDDYSDDRNLAAAAGAVFMKGIYRKITTHYPEISRHIETQLALSSGLEKEKAVSIDRAAEPYARIMEAIFRTCIAVRSEIDEEKQAALGGVGFHLGKWVYTIDAFDDIDENIKNGAFNPLLSQFEYGGAVRETADEFRLRIEERIEFSLLYCLAELAKAFDLLKIERNRELIENIVYLGLHRKTEEVLKKGRTDKNAESI